MLFNEFNMEDFGNVRHEEGALKKALDIARNLIVENIPLDTIKKATGLSIKDIESLQMAR